MEFLYWEIYESQLYNYYILLYARDRLQCTVSVIKINWKLQPGEWSSVIWSLSQISIFKNYDSFIFVFLAIS